MCSAIRTPSRALPRRRRWKAAADERGQATVEAAFALPVLMLLMLLMLQPAIILYDRIVMESAAAEGCRLLATSSDGASDANDDFVRRRLSAVPETDIFHVHAGGCSWSIGFAGDEAAREVQVTITNEVKPLPLIDMGASLLGLVNDRGNLVVEVSVSEATQPDWVFDGADGASPADRIGAWV